MVEGSFADGLAAPPSIDEAASGWPGWRIDQEKGTKRGSNE